MRKMISILSFIFTFSVQGSSITGLETENVVPGSGSTGGGYVVFCKATPIQPQKIQLLDFYEAENQFKFELVSSSQNIEMDYFRAIDRGYTLQGAPHLAEESDREDILHNLRHFFKVAEFVEDKKDLPHVDDVGETLELPSNCHLEQVIAYVDEYQKPIIHKPLWDKLTTLEQAALITHEVHGHWYRTMGDQTTETARNYVSHLYAKDPGLPRWHDVSGGASLKGAIHARGGLGYYGPSSTFYMLPFADATRLQFVMMFGRAILAKTYADLPKVPWELKAVMKGNKKECLVNTPGLDISGVVPVQGTMGGGYKVEYQMKYGEPIKLALVKGAFTVGRNVVSTCR